MKTTMKLGYYLNGNVSIHYYISGQVLSELMRCSLYTDALPLSRHPPHTFLPTKQLWMMLLDRYCVSTWLSVLFSSKRPSYKKTTFKYR